MFVSSSEPLLRERRPKSFFRVNIFYIFAIGLILTCVVCQQTVRNVFEAKVGGNEIGYPAGSSTLDLEAGFPPQAPPSPGSAVRASPTLSSGSNSPIPHDSQPAAQPQSPERPKSPLPSTKTGRRPLTKCPSLALDLRTSRPLDRTRLGPPARRPGGMSIPPLDRDCRRSHRSLQRPPQQQCHQQVFPLDAMIPCTDSRKT